MVVAAVAMVIVAVVVVAIALVVVFVAVAPVGVMNVAWLGAYPHTCNCLRL